MEDSRLKKLVRLAEGASDTDGSLNLFKRIAGMGLPLEPEAVDHITDAVADAEGLYRSLGFALGYLNRRDFAQSVSALKLALNDARGIVHAIETSINNVKEQARKEGELDLD